MGWNLTQFISDNFAICSWFDFVAVIVLQYCQAPRAGPGATCPVRAPGQRAPCGPRGIICPWFDFWFWHYICVCFFISYASSLILFSSLFSYLSFPLRIDSLRFRAECHKRWLNVALVFCFFFQCGLTWVVLDKGPLNVCLCVCLCCSTFFVVFVLGLVFFLSKPRDWIWRYVSKRTYFVSSGT